MSNQYLKLRRSGVPGKIPSTSSIDYGEIALNTHDGKAYMKVSGSSGIEVVPIGSNSGSFTGSFLGNLTGTASFAVSSSFAPNLYNSDGTLTGNRFVNIESYEFDIGSGSYKNLEIQNLNNTGSVIVRNSLYISGAPSGSILSDAYLSGSIKFPQLTIEAVYPSNPSDRFQIKAGGYGSNTWFGFEAMQNVVRPGTQNDAFGFRALQYLTTGFNNTAFGGWALGDTTTGTRNVAVGLDALWRNVSGSRNVGIGSNAGQDNISGSRNIYIGSDAGRGILSGSNNIIIGTITGLPAGLSDNIIISTGNAVTKARSFETGNWLFQNGGVFIDSGFRLDVNGSTRFGSSNQMTVQSTGQVDMKNGLTVTGSLNASNITGSLFGTASWAQNAVTSSYILNAVSASYSLNTTSASYALNTTSASYANTSSYSLNTTSASYADTASYVNTLNQNVTVVGNQTISGSLTITNNLTVLGSASVTFISESTLNIGTNLITVNTINPGARFGGLAVIDSGSSPLVSASFLYDSIQDEFLFVHKGTAGGVLTSSVFLLGPETFNDVGNEIYLTQNRLPKGSGIEHLYDSNISDDGSVVSINSNTEITGSLVATGLTDGSGSNHVVMYNTASGQFFFTASSAIGGGGGGNASNDNFQQIFLLMGG